MLQRIRLSVIDGVVCVAFTQTDYNAPRLITNHWPTKIKAHDLASHFDIPVERIGEANVKDCYPGEYYADNPLHHDGMKAYGPLGAALTLVNGAQTKSIQTDIANYPAPKNRGKRVEYRDGYWFKDSAKGWKRHESL